MKLLLIIVNVLIIVKSEHIVTVENNKSISLNCPTDESHSGKLSKAFHVVQWFKGSTRFNKLTMPERYSMAGMDNAILTIRNVEIHDAGYYRCNLVSGFGAVSYDFYVVVKDPESALPNNDVAYISKFFTKPIFTDSNGMLAVKRIRKPVGSLIQFDCNAIAFPSPDLLWYKNYQPIIVDDKRVTRSKWQLNIRDLRLADTGNYSCQVFNSFGLINATFSLDVYEDPTLSTKAKIHKSDFVNITVNSDMSVSLDCVIENQSNVDKKRTKWMKQITHSEYKDYVTTQINSDANNNFLYNTGGLFITKRSVEDTLHFITLTASSTIDQKLKFNPKKRIYVNQLVIQKASLKDAGVYVCFLDGQKHGKAELHVEPSNLYLQSGQYQTYMHQSMYQYISLLAFLIPVSIVILFAAFSLLCLKRMDKKRVSNLFRNVNFCTKDLSDTQEVSGGNKIITVNSISTNRDLQTYKMTSSYISECSSVYTPYYTIDPMLASVPSFYNTSTPAHRNNDTASTGLHRTESTPSMVYDKILEFEG